MSFPSSPRVVYRRNPLVQVICQLRFPTILEIGTEDPADFQKLIRQKYPLYNRQADSSPVSSRIPKEIGELMGRFGIAIGGPGTHKFTTEDETRSISLTTEFVAITEDAYVRWENLRPEIDLMVKSLVEVYKPAFFARIGLRYQDEIDKDSLGLESEPWNNLIKSEMLGLLGVSYLEKGIVESESTSLCSIDDQVPGAKIRIRQGLVARPEQNHIYRIDADLFVESHKGAEDVLPILDQLNRTGGNFFRWAITDQLAHALEPQAI
jgi:uncharacterized protein (TIGR04255 family)